MLIRACGPRARLFETLSSHTQIHRLLRSEGDKRNRCGMSYFLNHTTYKSQFLVYSPALEETCVSRLRPMPSLHSVRISLNTPGHWQRNGAHYSPRCNNSSSFEGSTLFLNYVSTSCLSQECNSQTQPPAPLKAMRFTARRCAMKKVPGSRPTNVYKPLMP